MIVRWASPFTYIVIHTLASVISDNGFMGLSLGLVYLSLLYMLFNVV